MDRICIFWGSKKDFNKFLDENITEYDLRSNFMEIIQDYNSRIRPNAALNDEDRKCRFDVENLIVKSSDYASVLDSVFK